MIVFDGIVFSLQTYGGISVYFNAILEKTKAAGIPFELRLGADRLQGRPSAAAQPFWRPVRERAFERYRDFECDADLAHSSYFRLPRAVSGKASPKSVVTIYDFTYERYFGRAPRLVHCWQKYRAIRKADAVLCISESTRRDLFRYVRDVDPRKVVVTHLAANSAFFDRGADVIATQAALNAAVPETARNAGYVIYVGSRRTYKNFEPLLHALSDSQLHLVCVGGGSLTDAEQVAAAKMVAGRLHHVSWADDELLRAMYRHATVLVFTSLYEGFGIPLVEAMAVGCPVVAGAVSSMPEVVGDAAILLDSVNADTLRQAIRDVQTPSRRGDMVARGLDRARQFTWQRCFDATLAAYDELCGLSA